MNNLLSNQSWAEFFLQAFMSHWFIAIVLVLLVGAFVSAKKSLNATTRHNIWLITLVSFLLMPLLVFLPKPDIDLPSFSVVQNVTQTPNVEVTLNEAMPEAPALARLESTPQPMQPNTGTGQNTGQNTTRTNQNIAPVISASKGISRVAGIAAPVTSPVTVSKQISLTALLKAVLVFWLVGAAFLVRRLWGEYRAARELELQSDSVTPYFERRFKQLCERLDIKEKPLLRFHVGINAPMTVGLYRVWVAIPMVWREEIDDDVFDQTLTHELGHIARKDPLVHTIQRLMNILFWMYPAVWYVSRQLELERESACDDWVLTHDGKGHTYANNLLNVAESLYLQPDVLAVGCLRSHSQLSRRIQNLLNKSSDHAIRNSRKLLAGVTTALFLTLGVSAVMWPDANAYLASQTVEQIEQTGDVAGDVGFLEADPENKTSGSMLVLNGVEIDPDTSMPAHKPFPAPPEPPKTVRNNADNTYHYSYADEDKYSELIQNDKYGKGSLSIERKNGVIKEISVKPAISKAKQPLLYAAWNNDLDELKRYVSKGKDVNTVYERSTVPRTVLDAAILKGHQGVVEYLIDNGAELNRVKNSRHVKYGQMNALTTAALAGNVDIAKYLMERGAKPDNATMIVAVQSKNVKLLEYFIDQEFELEDDLLIIAVQNRDQEMIDVLLDHDVDIDDGALIVAVQNHDKTTVKRLLKAGADIDDGALVIAIQNRDDEMVDWLLEAGAEPDDGALVIAVQNRNKPLVKRLLKAGADIDDGALVIAIQNRDNEMVDWLLEAGAEPDDGALVIAVQNRNKPLVKRLLKAGADIDDGALVIAIQNRDDEMVDWLLEAGAEPDDGALVIAIQNHNKTLVKRLIEAGADIDDGSLIIAIQNQDVDTVRWLLKAGAPVDDGAMIVAIQSRNKEIIALIQKEYQSEAHSSKEYDFNSLESLQALEGLEKLEGLKELEKFEVLGETYGEEFGEYIAEGVVTFLGDMAGNGANFESLALVKALENRDHDLALDLLKDGAIPNTLHITQALEQKDGPLVRKLMEHGARPNALNLLQALENNEFQLAKELMHEGAKPNGIVLLKVMETENREMIDLVRQYMKNTDGSDNDNEAFLQENEQQNQYLSQSLNLDLRENLLQNISYNTANFSPAVQALEDCPEEQVAGQQGHTLVLAELPVAHGRITKNYDQAAKKGHDPKAHRGVDIAASQGTPIKAVADGVVIKAMFHKTYGNVVQVDHGNGYISHYAHNQKNLVQQGDTIQIGDVIALVGNTGKSSGPHVHFDISHNGRFINPLDLLVDRHRAKIKT